MRDRNNQPECRTQKPLHENSQFAQFASSLNGAQLTPTESTIEQLLDRIMQGDRSAAAEFINRYGTRLRRRIRGKLGPSVRRLYDSVDIISTLGRRLDLYILSGRLQVTNENQLWSLLFKMADHAMTDKARIIQRLQSSEGEHSKFANEAIAQIKHAQSESKKDEFEIEVEKCVKSITDPIDRRILSLWLLGSTHEETANEIGLAPTAVRKRWEGIRKKLRKTFEAGWL